MSNEIGAALIIPDDVLKKIDDADEKVKQLQDTADTAAKGITSSFGNMAIGTKPFSDALDLIISKLSSIDTKAKGMSGSLNNIGATKAAQEVTQMNGAIINAAENIDRMAASQKKVTNSSDFSNSISDWQNLQTQIDATNNRQQELTKLMRQYELEQQRFNSGKGGVIYRDDQANYAAAQKEFEANKNVISSLREKQQQIVNNNQALSKQIELTNSLRSYAQDHSFSDMRYKAEMQQLKEDIQLRAKKAAESQKQSNKEQAASDKEAKAIEKAEERKRAAWAKSTAAYGQQYHNERQAMYNQLFSTRNTTVPTAVTYSQSATTLRDHIAAIKELQQARLNLDTADKNYKQNLATVNDAIKHHSRVLREAGVNAENLANKTSYLSRYVSQLWQRTLVLFSVDAVKNFANNLVDVRGQMELAQISLESILQNKTKADEIFNKTVELAIQSPFRIKDLVTYTRQLSAYRIENDKLYDTTKRLADVSAGLGVDMGRLILAYGQVKAAAYLRGSEVRQFTEAGINMYGELQQYFKEVKGEAYTTAQIVDMISKRKVTFEDVEAIFQRMTDKGGTFYNMQEIQANTLYGMVQKFYDAFDVMLNDIGKSGEGLLKGAVSTATELLKCWKEIFNVIKAVVTMLVAIKAHSIFINSEIGKAFMMANGSGLKKTKALAVNYFNSMKTAISGMAGSIKAGLAGAAIYAAIEAIMYLVTATIKYKKAVREAKEETIKTRGAIAEISNTYRELASATKDTNTNDKDLEKNIDDKRATLQKLVDSANKDGLDIKINVDLIKKEDLDKTFSEIEEKYKDFADKIEAIRKAYSSSEKYDTWVTDGIGDNEKDYRDAAIDFLSNSSKMELVIAKIKDNFDKLNPSARKFYNEIAAGQKEGESNLAYMTRMADVVYDLNKSMTGFGGTMPSFASDMQENVDTIFSSLQELRIQKQRLLDDFEDIFKIIKEKKLKDPIEIKALIDKIAAEKDWSQYSKELAYEEFKINVSIDRNKAKKEVSWVDKYLENFFAKKKYRIYLVPSEITDDEALQKFLDKGDQAAEAARNWRELEKRLASVKKNQKQIEVDDDLRKIFKAGEIPDMVKFIDVDIVRKKAQEYKKAATESALSLGVNPFEKEDAKKNKQNAKKQRDILQERVNLLKDLNSKYNELTKTEGKERALADTREYYKDAANSVGLNITDFTPDDKTIVKKLKDFAANVNDVAKRGNILRLAADIEFKANEEKLKKQLDEIKKYAEDQFSQLELFKKLKDTGIDDGTIKNMFGDIVSSFDDVRASLNKKFESEYGSDRSKWSENATNEYEEQVRKLNDKIYQDQVSQTERLIKEYKNQLSDQLQLDNWYFAERRSLEENEGISKDPALKKQLLDNLTSKYNKKTDENSWKHFKESDTYINIFSNLDTISTKAIENMRTRLESLKEQLKNLDPSQLKEVMSIYNKMSEQLADRNPLKSLLTSLSEIKKLREQGITEDSLVNQISSNDTENVQLENEISTINKIINLKKVSSGLTEDDKKFIANNNKLYTESDEHLQKMITDKQRIIDNNNKETATANKNLESYSSARYSLQQLSSEWENIKSLGQNAMGSINTILEAMGKDTDSADMALVNMAGSIADLIVQAIMFQLQLQLCAVAAGAMAKAMAAAMGPIGWIVLALQGVATVLSTIFGNKDKKLQKQIEAQQRAVQSLQRAYDKLKKSIDDAFDTSKLLEYKNKSIETLKAEEKAYQAMINAESSKKKKDESKIQEYQEKIEDLEAARKELQESVTESLGGFGSEANYKSAAQEFADAWVDAFNEGEDALDALNEKFDDYFNTLIKKQLMYRASERFIKPVMEAIDKAVSEGSEGGTNGMELTRSEIAHIKELWKTNSEGFSEYAKSLMDVLGVSPSSSSTLSDLQQGIQSMSEATGSALESIMESIRYYVAQQQSDVRIIRDTLIAKLGAVANAGTDGESSNMMINLLQQQANYLKKISGNWDSVLRTGHTKGGYGIKVFMN